MSTEYKVFPDRVKESISFIVYLLFISGLTVIIASYKPNILLTGLLAVLILLLLFFEYSILKKILQNKVLYLIERNGITDMTRPEKPLFLSWENVLKIEMVSNNSTLQIGVLGSKEIEENDQMSQAIKENLLRNGNFAFYSLMIDGFSFRKKQFNEIFSQLKYFSRANETIIIIDYEDPILKKKKNEQATYS